MATEEHFGNGLKYRISWHTVISIATVLLLCHHFVSSSGNIFVGAQSPDAPDDAANDEPAEAPTGEIVKKPEEEEEKKPRDDDDDPEAQWQEDRDLFLDLDNYRSDTVVNITESFLEVTKKMVKAGRLMIEMKRRVLLFIRGIHGDVSYDAKWAMMAWVATMFLCPIFTGAIVALIISMFFQTELTNLQIVLHTRWDVGDRPDIITESKAKRRLGNLAMQRLYHKMSRHPAKFLPKQGKRDPEALVREKEELPPPKEPGAPPPQ